MSLPASLAGTPVASLALGSRGRGHQELFVVFSDGTVLRRWWEGSSWSGWVVFAEGMPLVHLAVGSLEHSHLEVFGIRKDTGELVHRWFDETAGWGGWNDMRVTLVVDNRKIDPDTGRIYDPPINHNPSGVIQQIPSSKAASRKVDVSDIRSAEDFLAAIDATDDRRRNVGPRDNPIRVHELARELKLTSKQILKRLEDQGEAAKSASSTISGASASRVRAYFRRTPPR